MDFKKFTAGYESYGTDEKSTAEYEKGVTNVDFEDKKFWEHWNDENSANYKKLEEFIIILAVCQSIIIEKKKDGTILYNANSPDELALTNAARHFGYGYIDRDANGNIVVHNTKTGNDLLFELLNVIEFNSARKRMTVIVRNPAGKILCITKGADSHIIPRLHLG